MPKNLSRIAVSEIADQVAAARRGQKTAVVERHADALGVSAGTVWRAVRASRGATRKPRSDRGKTAIAEGDIRAVEGIKLKAYQRGGRSLPTRRAVRMLSDSGDLESPISVATANRLIAGRRVLAERGYARFQAAAPNVIHHVDFTGSAYFRPVCEDGEWFAEVRPRPVRKDEKIKTGDAGMRLWVASLVDDHSRAMRMQYIVSAGESAVALISFLQGAWTRRDGDPFCGLPEIVMTDNGSAFRSQAFGEMVRSIDRGLQAQGMGGLRWQPRSAYDKQTGGKVERRFRSLKEDFELAFLARHEGARIPVAQLNEFLPSWVAEQNGLRHPFFRNLSRLDAWRRSIVRVREVPPDLLSLTLCRADRKVARDGCIQFEGDTFRVGGDLAGSWVEVRHSLSGDVFAVLPWGETRELKPLAPVFAWPWKDKADAEKAALRAVPDGGRLPTFGIEPDALRESGKNLVQFPVPGDETTPVTPIGEPVFETETDAMGRIMDIIGVPIRTLPPGLRAAVDAALADNLGVADVERFALNLRDQVSDLDRLAESG